MRNPYSNLEGRKPPTYRFKRETANPLVRPDDDADITNRTEWDYDGYLREESDFTMDVEVLEYQWFRESTLDYDGGLNVFKYRYEYKLLHGFLVPETHP